MWLDSLQRSFHRWLFFIEGGLTCAIAATGIYIIPNFPTTPAPWLTVEEQLLAQRRMLEDLRGVKKKDTGKSVFVEAFSDWSVWWLALTKIILTIGLSYGNYFPTLAATMGFSTSVTLLLCAVPWILGVASSFVISRFVIWSISFPVTQALFAGTQMLQRIASGTSLSRSSLGSPVLP